MNNQGAFAFSYVGADRLAKLGLVRGQAQDVVPQLEGRPAKRGEAAQPAGQVFRVGTARETYSGPAPGSRGSLLPPTQKAAAH